MYSPRLLLTFLSIALLQLACGVERSGTDDDTDVSYNYGCEYEYCDYENMPEYCEWLWDEYCCGDPVNGCQCPADFCAPNDPPVCNCDNVDLGGVLCGEFVEDSCFHPDACGPGTYACGIGGDGDGGGQQPVFVKGNVPAGYFPLIFNTIADKVADRLLDPQCNEAVTAPGWENGYDAFARLRAEGGIDLNGGNTGDCAGHGGHATGSTKITLCNNFYGGLFDNSPTIWSPVRFQQRLVLHEIAHITGALSHLPEPTAAQYDAMDQHIMERCGLGTQDAWRTNIWEDPWDWNFTASSVTASGVIPPDVINSLIAGLCGTRPAPSTRCSVTVPDCPAYPYVQGTFDDSWDGSATDASRCMQRAPDYYYWCGTSTPVTATFYTNGAVTASTTYP